LAEVLAPLSDFDGPQERCHMLKSPSTRVWAFGKSRTFAKSFALKGLKGDIGRNNVKFGFGLYENSSRVKVWAHEISFWGVELWTRRAVPPKLLWLFLYIYMYSNVFKSGNVVKNLYEKRKIWLKFMFLNIFKKS